MKLLRVIFLLALPLAALATPSDPVGMFRLTLPGSSDTFVSLPLHRPALKETRIISRTGNQLSCADDIPAWDAAGAYVLVMSGALEGAVLPAVARSAATVTIEPGTYDPSRLRDDATAGLGTGDRIALIPYWTLDTLFPAGAGVNVSTSSSNRATDVLLFDDSQPGTNLSAALTFFYFAGNMSKPAGWYQVGNTSAPVGSQRLGPTSFFVVRHKIATGTTLSLPGAVQMGGYRLPLSVRSANVDQDNVVGLPVATPVTLDDSALVSSGAFTPSTSAANRRDELLVFDNSAVSWNKSAAATYFYFVGSMSKPAGWYRVGDTAHLAGTVVLKPGDGYVIRKRGTAVPATAEWSGVPPYLE